MTLEFRRYHPTDAPAIARLNQRLAAGQARYPAFDEDPVGAAPEAPFRSRIFVAADGDEIRGTVLLSEQQLQVGDRAVDIGWVRYPVGESQVDARYGGVPGALLLHLRRQQPRLAALGLGGHDGPFARLLASMKWSGSLLPLHVLIARPARVLHGLPRLRGSAVRRAGLDALAATGLGWAGLRAVQWARRGRTFSETRGYRADVVETFGDWADAVWERSRGAYGAIATRDRRTLEFRYPTQSKLVTRLRVRHGGETVGWACVVGPDPTRALPDHHFGLLEAAALADALAEPRHAAGVLDVATRHAIDAGFDLVITNHSHPAWNGALAGLGYFAAPSNFAFYRSPAFDEVLTAATRDGRGLYLNRGDCDGPWLG